MQSLTGKVRLLSPQTPVPTIGCAPSCGPSVEGPGDDVTLFGTWTLWPSQMGVRCPSPPPRSSFTSPYALPLVPATLDRRSDDKLYHQDL